MSFEGCKINKAERISSSLNEIFLVYDQVTLGSSCYRVLKKGTYEDCTKIQGILAEPSQSEPFFPDEVRGP